MTNYEYNRRFSLQLWPASPVINRNIPSWTHSSNTIIEDIVQAALIELGRPDFKIPPKQ